jgi:phosphatidylglycerol:prolipoprotein diacylglycerol transferase
MSRYLVDLGIFQISWYSIFILLGIFIGGTFLLREARKFNIDSDFLSNLVFWTTIYAIIGARLYFVAFNWSNYSNNLIDILRIWEGGLPSMEPLFLALSSFCFIQRNIRLNCSVYLI